MTIEKGSDPGTEGLIFVVVLLLGAGREQENFSSNIRDTGVYSISFGYDKSLFWSGQVIFNSDCRNPENEVSYRFDGAGIMHAAVHYLAELGSQTTGNLNSSFTTPLTSPWTK